MIKVLLYDSETKIIEKTDVGRLKERGLAERLIWVDLDSPTKEEIDAIVRELDIKPLTMRMITSERLPPKIIIGHTMAFLSWSSLDAAGKGESKRFSCVFGHGFLVTFRQGPVHAVDEILTSVERDSELMSQGSGRLLYEILDAAVDGCFLAVDALSEEVDALEDAMFGSPGANDVRRLFTIKRGMLDLRRTVAPEREAINSLLRRHLSYQSENDQLFFADLYDHLVRVIDLIDTLRDVTSGAMQIYQATISNNLNAIMKTLTIIATIVMPLTLLSGFFGMNVDWFGGGALLPAYALIIVTLVMLVIAVGMLAWFWKRGWL